MYQRNSVRPWTVVLPTIDLLLDPQCCVATSTVYLGCQHARCSRIEQRHVSMRERVSEREKSAPIQTDSMDGAYDDSLPPSFPPMAAAATLIDRPSPSSGVHSDLGGARLAADSSRSYPCSRSEFWDCVYVVPSAHSVVLFN